MMHKAWCNLEEVPYNFSRSSIKFQGHTGWKIDDLIRIWVRLQGRSQLTNPSDLPCFISILWNVLVFEIPLRGRQLLVYTTLSLTWLLVAWWCEEYQRSWYGPCFTSLIWVLNGKVWKHTAMSIVIKIDNQPCSVVTVSHFRATLSYDTDWFNSHLLTYLLYKNTHTHFCTMSPEVDYWIISPAPGYINFILYQYEKWNFPPHYRQGILN